MPNQMAAIIKFLPQAVDKVYCQNSVTRVLENNRRLINFNFTKAGYVEIARVLLSGGLSDYRRAYHEPQEGFNYSHHNPAATKAGQRDGFGAAPVKTDWEIYKLRYCRAVQLQIDHIDNEESGGVALANSVVEFVRLKVVPEIDEVRLATLAANTYTSFGNRVTGTITADNALSTLQDAFLFLNEHAVPESNQIIFVSNSFYTTLAKSKELSKYIIAGTYTSSENVTFTVNMFQGRPIIPVNSDRFYTNPIIDPNNGYRPSSTSKIINFMVCAADSGVPIMKLNYQKTFGEDVNPQFYGTITNLLFYHDMIVPENKAIGIYCHVSATKAADVVNVVNVHIKYVSANTYLVPKFLVTPASISGLLVYSSTKMELGTKYTVDSDCYAVKVMQPGNVVGALTDITGYYNTITGTTCYFAVLDDKGFAQAVSKEVTLPTSADDE